MARDQSSGRVSGRFSPGWTQPSRSAMNVRSKARARLRPEPLAHQLGRAVGAVGRGGQVDGDRHVAEVAVAAHRVVRAGEDEPLDPGQGRGVEDVGQGVEVGPLQVLPGGELVGVGRQVDHRVDAVEVGRSSRRRSSARSAAITSGSSGSAARSIRTRS